MMVNGQIIAGMYPQNAIRALRYLRTALDFCDPWKPEYLDKVSWPMVVYYIVYRGTFLRNLREGSHLKYDS